MRAETSAVTAYSGWRGDESPKVFFINGERIDVVGILKRWVEEDVVHRARKRFFTVKGSDGYVYTLYFDQSRASWFKTG